MKYILLCGGIGIRNNQYSLPKPMNYVNGKHLIEYIVSSIPSDEIYIIYNILLEEYHIKEVLINKFKTKQFHFASIPFLTRGAVETGYIGLQSFSLEDENILFIDNDNYHIFPLFPSTLNHSFIGYGHNYDKQNFSFITIKNKHVTNIEEKNKISDNYCCGLYGFKNKESFMNLAKDMIHANQKTKNEFYFSQIYKILLERNEPILSFFVEKTTHLGTYQELLNESTSLPKKQLRICFDLDNTLVTYPTIPGDYSTVQPINKNIHLLRDLKSQGHEIIIHTARRMETHKNDLGKVMKDIARITFQTLDDLNICYDEILFGKPIADIYIDDKCYNPYYNDISFFGIFDDKKTETIVNKVETNKYNEIRKKNNEILKTGPSQYMKGELFFYESIPTEFQCYFPKLLDFDKKGDLIHLKMEYIQGIPLYFLYKSRTFTFKMMDDLFVILNKLHTFSNHVSHITKENIKSNYIQKLKSRFNPNDYYFEDAVEIFQQIQTNLEETFQPIIASMIHGDFWFSNILLTYDDHYKLLDMKGQVDSILTTSGDIYYDYGKMYQSILGYDLVLHNHPLDEQWIESNKRYFLKKCQEKELDIDYLTAVTKSLIFGSFYFLKNSDPKDELWKFLKKINI